MSILSSRALNVVHQVTQRTRTPAFRQVPRAWTQYTSKPLCQIGNVLHKHGPRKLPKKKPAAIPRSMFSNAIVLDVPGQGTQRWSPIWLRENCPCSKCTHPETRQRLIDTVSIPLDIRARDIRTDSERGVIIQWDQDGHISTYNWDWLCSHIIPKQLEGLCFRSDLEFVPDDPSAFPTVDYNEVMASDDGVREWTRKIYLYGFCFVKGCPVEPKATEKLLERIAFIRRTHYGDFWDFTSNLAMKDMAYTTEALPVHTDTAYFTDAAGLQMFHLLSHTGGDGGETLLVDGFEAARILHTEKKDAYYALKHPIFSHHASGNKDICIRPGGGFPTFSHRTYTGELYQVRWNNEDRGAATSAPISTLERWYFAAREWSELLKRPSLVRQFKLEPGTPLIFDNWRMLHGRTAFTGERRVCGGYINRDDFISRYELLAKGREKVLMEI